MTNILLYLSSVFLQKIGRSDTHRFSAGSQIRSQTNDDEMFHLSVPPYFWYPLREDFIKAIALVNGVRENEAVGHRVRHGSGALVERSICKLPNSSILSFLGRRQIDRDGEQIEN
jgi:hypothetical protein